MRLDSPYRRVRLLGWNHGNNKSNVLLRRLLEDDADEKAEAAAEVGNNVILQQIDAEEAAEIKLEHTTVPEEAMHIRALFRS